MRFFKAPQYPLSAKRERERRIIDAILPYHVFYSTFFTIAFLTSLTFFSSNNPDALSPTRKTIYTLPAPDEIGDIYPILAARKKYRRANLLLL